MRVLSIAVCLSVAASLAACQEEPQTWFPPDAGKAAGDAGRPDGGSPTALGGMDAGIPAKLPVSTEDERAVDEEWQIFQQDGGVENPAQGITGVVTATAIDGGTRFELEVANLSVAQKFGAHLHQLPCDQMQGGPHYQNTPAGMGQANDPAFANPKNEVWLDFESTFPEDSETAEATSSATVAWVPRKGTAGSIVVHERTTGDGGVAGARLACTNMSFVQ